MPTDLIDRLNRCMDVDVEEALDLLYLLQQVLHDDLPLTVQTEADLFVKGLESRSIRKGTELGFGDDSLHTVLQFFLGQIVSFSAEDVPHISLVLRNVVRSAEMPSSQAYVLDDRDVVSHNSLLLYYNITDELWK